MSYRTIVVGTDGSATAGVAQHAAALLAKRLRAELVLVCAYTPPRINRALAASIVERAAAAARQDRVEPSVELAQAEPAELILETAERRNAGLIVVGNKGIGQGTRFRLGSVPDRVAHNAPCDLLIVNTTRRVATGTGMEGLYRKVLVGTDGSPTAAEAARKTMELAMLLRARVTLAYVGDPILGAIALEETAGGRPDGVDVETRVLAGDPAEEMCALAEAEGVELMVVGNKGLSGARRFFLGSVPLKVTHYAPSDVLIVKTIDRTVDELAPGHGALIDMGGRKLAVYKDEDGHTLQLSPKCTHMGCMVDWNSGDRTWDCPCHGSRYSWDGTVLHGPAQKPLEPVGPPSDVKAPAAAMNGAAAPAAASVPAERPEPRRREAPLTADRFVIVGAGLTGATAAATLREGGFGGYVVLVGSEPSFPYERPPLSKSFLRGETPIEQALVRPPAFYEVNRIDTRFGSTVTGIDPATKTITVAGGDPIEYDKLLIATGARNRRFPIPGIALDGIYDLRTATDASRIRAEMTSGRRVVIGGMGFIGSEVAASFRSRGLEVTVVDGGRVPLARVLGEDVGRVLEGIHRDHGVQMVFEDRVASFEGDGRVERVVTAGGKSLECDFVLLGLGVEPNTGVAAGTAIAVENGILVDELCRTNVPDVFAAGDVANHYHPVFGRRIRTEHWQNARLQGRAAALSMMGRGVPYDEVHWFWSDQYDVNIQYAGYHTEWDELVVRGRLEDRNFAAFYLKDGKVLAVVAMNRGQDVQRAMGLIKAGAPVEPARLGDDTVELASLAPVG
jgi:3-phenylpropionate/trans-cinnamate dioxygenase ferredoxin reductase component